MSVASELAAQAKQNFDSAPDHVLGFATNAKDIPGKVLLALHQPHMACVLAIPADEWDALEAARVLGFPRRTLTAQDVLAKLPAK